jgi:hypothetical protein
MILPKIIAGHSCMSTLSYSPSEPPFLTSQVERCRTGSIISPKILPLPLATPKAARLFYFAGICAIVYARVSARTTSVRLFCETIDS